LGVFKSRHGGTLHEHPRLHPHRLRHCRAFAFFRRWRKNPSHPLCGWSVTPLPVSNSKYKTLNRNIGRALHRYDMLQDGDRIVIGLSGGADSMVMMWMLAERLPRIPLSYELFPVYIDPGFEGSCSESLKAWSAAVGFNLRVEYTDYGILGHSSSNRENPCFLCSRLRRRRLFEIADEMGCNKLALGHNKDDIIETLFLNIFFAGVICTMVPSQAFFKGRFTIIRPLAYAEEELIRVFAREQCFPEFVNPCPSADNSKRREIKNILKKLYSNNNKIKGNIFRAMSRVKTDYLLK
jgi:tRNA 2-thiocytidine biosynthesis protein TtcA